jgi:hypothetical protein
VSEIVLKKGVYIVLGIHYGADTYFMHLVTKLLGYYSEPSLELGF